MIYNQEAASLKSAYQEVCPNKREEKNDCGLSSETGVFFAEGKEMNKMVEELARASGDPVLEFLFRYVRERGFHRGVLMWQLQVKGEHGPESILVVKDETTSRDLSFVIPQCGRGVRKKLALQQALALGMLFIAANYEVSRPKGKRKFAVLRESVRVLEVPAFFVAVLEEPKGIYYFQPTVWWTEGRDSFHVPRVNITASPSAVFTVEAQPSIYTPQSIQVCSKSMPSSGETIRASAAVDRQVYDYGDTFCIVQQIRIPCYLNRGESYPLQLLVSDQLVREKVPSPDPLKNRGDDYVSANEQTAGREQFVASCVKCRSVRFILVPVTGDQGGEKDRMCLDCSYIVPGVAACCSDGGPPSGLKDDGLGGFNPYGNGQTAKRVIRGEKTMVAPLEDLLDRHLADFGTTIFKIKTARTAEKRKGEEKDKKITMLLDEIAELRNAETIPAVALEYLCNADSNHLSYDVISQSPSQYVARARVDSSVGEWSVECSTAQDAKLQAAAVYLGNAIANAQTGLQESYPVSYYAGSCVICHEREADVVVRCGHICMCKQCSIDSHSCPVCRSDYPPGSPFRVYLSGVVDVPSSNSSKSLLIDTSKVETELEVQSSGIYCHKCAVQQGKSLFSKDQWNKRYEAVCLSCEELWDSDV